MKIKDIRNTASEELVKQVDEAHQELFNLRFQLATGKAKNYKRIPEVRRNIAQMETILRERELEGSGAE